MSGRQEHRENPRRRVYTADEVTTMMTDEDFYEPCCPGSDDDLSAEEVDSDNDE